MSKRIEEEKREKGPPCEWAQNPIESYIEKILRYTNTIIVDNTDKREKEKKGERKKVSFLFTLFSFIK